MTFFDNRGANYPIYTLASVDINNRVTWLEEGSPRPITTETFQTEIKDDETGGVLSVHTHEVTDAANGEWFFKLPYSAFAGKEDQEFSHETYYIDTDGNRYPLMYGLIQIEARG